MNSHANRILEYLQSGGSLTVQKSEQLWGRRRLGARIHELKQSGHDIQKQMIEVETRFGEKSHVAEYYLRKPE